MRQAENIREAEALGIDWMGFIFWPKSSRYVAERPTYLPTRCKRVGVFVDEQIEQVRHVAEDYALDIIQLHGNESPEYARTLAGHTLIPTPPQRPSGRSPQQAFATAVSQMLRRNRTSAKPCLMQRFASAN